MNDSYNKWLNFMFTAWEKDYIKKKKKKGEKNWKFFNFTPPTAIVLIIICFRTFWPQVLDRSWCDRGGSK